MADSHFVRKVTSPTFGGTGNAKGRSTGITGIKDVEADDSSYEFSAATNGVEGTKIPRTNTNWGIVGSRKYRGKVVMGNRMTYEGDGLGFKALGELEPSELIREHAEPVDKEGNSVLREPEEEEEEEYVDWDEEAKGMLDELEEYKDYSPPPAQMPTQQAPVQIPVPMQYQPQPDKIRVKMQGAFGTYRGKYTRLVETDDLVVLMYDLSDPVYSPPASTDAFQISCGQKKHEVYFAGIEFELDFFKQGVQVFVKQE